MHRCRLLGHLCGEGRMTASMAAVHSMTLQWRVKTWVAHSDVNFPWQRGFKSHLSVSATFLPVACATGSLLASIVFSQNRLSVGPCPRLFHESQANCYFTDTAFLWTLVQHCWLVFDKLPKRIEISQNPNPNYIGIDMVKRDERAWMRLAFEVFNDYLAEP